MSPFLYSIIIPFAAGFLCLISPRRLREFWAILGSLITLILVILLYSNKFPSYPVPGYLLFDKLNSFILLAVALFGFLIALYSLKYMGGKPRLREYYTYLMWTVGASLGALLSNNLLLLLIFWGFLGLTLYLLINIGGEKASGAAKKTFIIVGGSDALMLLGIIIIYFLSGSLRINELMANKIPLSGEMSVLAYLCLAIAAFAKAGAMPFHTWIPDMAETAPMSVTAFLPASLDKLLGIYLLARITLNLFIMNSAMGLMLLIVGAITVIAAVMMALIQHDLKRLLSYHAVSQVGYMVLGIGTLNPVGIAGGIFHMLNNAIYKGCLFLCGGGVENQTKTTDLNKLGGLAKLMPVTFITSLIAALSISGVPPFNGFVSKWMVYQGIVEMGKGGNRTWIIWLVAAMFGSALTLASFMKVIHSTFLGKSYRGSGARNQGLKEVSWTMWFPMAVLAFLCVLFGVFALAIPLKKFILPTVQPFSFTGVWGSTLATLMILIALGIGGIIYLISKVSKFRTDESYIGGEKLSPEMRVSGVEFYNTVQEMGFLKRIYQSAEDKAFDIYEVGRSFLNFFTRWLRDIHTGWLPTYLSWCLLGLFFLLAILLRG